MSDETSIVFHKRAFKFAMLKILLENKKQTIKRNYVCSQNSMESYKDSIDY